MNKKKICVVVTARPSYSRIKTALVAIREHPGLELQLVVAASALLDKYGSAVEFMEQDGFTINEKVFMVLEGSSPTGMAKTTGVGIMELATAFYNLEPDMVVTVGDRYETMATAVAASYMNIPLVHVQGGEVTGNIDEKVRHAITKLSDLHLVSSEDARQRLLRMGEREERIHLTGCPSIDLADEVFCNPVLDFNPNHRYGGVGPSIDHTGDYIVVMQHPVTTEFGEAFHQANETMDAVLATGLPAFWFWPNVDAGSDGTSRALRNYRENVRDLPVRFFKNMEGRDFLKLLANSRCLIGNSSVGIRECSYLGVPVVNIGSRQNRRERGRNVTDTDYSATHIREAILKQLDHGKFERETIYGEGNAGERIAKVLHAENPDIVKVITY
ncbi:MAG: UDP-N-acetylglucosamine 2-epimerase [Bacteroidota bacterium]|jgi:UDP-hydrolysing UDP-N-acetyl-D-glucosamine 2-epimerase